MQQKVNPSIYDSDYYLHAYSDLDTFILDKNPPYPIAKAIDLVKPKKGMVVLDLGCGRGELVLYNAFRGCKAIGIDYSQDAIDIANAKLKSLNEKVDASFMREDIVNIDLNEQFDIIFMTDLVEHLYDWQLKIVFKRCKELLKPDGKIVIHTAPNKDWINIIFPLKRFLRCKRPIHYQRDKYSYDSAMHVNEQTPRSLKKLLKEFKIKMWCEDGSSNFISLLTKKFMGSDIWCIAERS